MIFTIRDCIAVIQNRTGSWGLSSLYISRSSDYVYEHRIDRLTHISSCSSVCHCTVQNTAGKINIGTALIFFSLPTKMSIKSASYLLYRGANWISNMFFCCCIFWFFNLKTNAKFHQILINFSKNGTKKVQKIGANQFLELKCPIGFLCP